MAHSPMHYLCDHIHVRCLDIASTARFYKDVFDAQVFHRPGASPPLTEVEVAGIRLFLSPALESGSEPYPNLTKGVWQLAFRVQNLDETLQMLKSKGIPLSKSVLALPSGAKAAFIEDPDGVEIELIERPERLTK